MSKVFFELIKTKSPGLASKLAKYKAESLAKNVNHFSNEFEIDENELTDLVVDQITKGGPICSSVAVTCAKRLRAEMSQKEFEAKEKAKAEAKAKSKAEAKAKAEAESEAKAKSKAEAKAKSEEEAKAKSEAKAEAKEKSEAVAKAKSEAKSQGK